MLPPSRSLHHSPLSELSRIPEAYFFQSLFITVLLTTIFLPTWVYLFVCFLICLSPPHHTLEFELPESRDFTRPTQTGTESGPWHMTQTQIFVGWTSGQPRIWHERPQIEALPLNAGTSSTIPVLCLLMGSRLVREKAPVWGILVSTLWQVNVIVLKFHIPLGRLSLFSFLKQV